MVPVGDRLGAPANFSAPLLWVPIILAAISATVRSVTTARASAEALDSRAHQIACLDVESKELHEAWETYLLGLGSVNVVNWQRP